ncbi:DUF6383 domain-containing protein [Parabacteroides johnsonii]|uniref:DUF6383 domain-containing protein n=1 Tax=Parabacteroides johnsonii TaxID=387661 RepID=UPI002432FBEE|nr:DUF6383 domain-containing protein [Parabacteroides johnsonii]MBS6223344.1 hypothetical protein [Parabacteroides johnsonii]
MNKRISTLLAAGLLMVGALFGSANAAPTAKAAKGDLQNGAKFYLGSTNGYIKVDQTHKVNGTAVSTFAATGDAAIENAALFEIADYAYNAIGDFSTFTLKADGKPFYVTKANGNALSADVTDVATVTNIFTVEGKGLNFTKLSVLNLAGQFEVNSAVATKYDVNAAGTAATAWVAKTDLTVDDLNANLSGQGFKFAFPNAVSDPDVNPFADQMIAVGASTVDAALTTSVISTAATSGMYFVKADAAGKKLLATGFTKAQVEAATFIVLNPEKNFGITGLDAATGEGYDFTTVKGNKLANNNVKKDGKVASVNGVFAVSEDDPQNAEGEYTITLANAKVEGNDNTPASSLSVGAYSLTTGGIKTYITTVGSGNADKLSLAMTTSNTWAAAADVLKADDAAIYNISFLGTKPANTADAAKSLYGKYLIPTYGAAFGAAVAAPEDVDVNAPLAQWVVSAVSGRNFEFKNRETNVTFTVSMYKTDKAGEYAISTAALSTGTAVTGIVAGSVDLTDISNWKYQIVKLTPITESEGFLALTDAQLSQQTELVFNGTGSVTVEKLYMAYTGSAAPAYFVPINNPAYSVQWMFEKAESVKNKMKYAYLDGTDVKQKDSVVNIATSYLLYNLKNDNSKQYFGGVASDYKAANDKDNAQRLFFKKNADGTYAMMRFAKAQISLATDALSYSAVVKADAKKWSVNTSSASFEAGTATLDELDAPYSAVTVDFNALSESLEAVARHATFNSEEGAVAVKQNKNGILEGIIGEGMTFWLDTADIDKDFHSFYISKGNGEEEARDFLYFATDSMLHWDANKADYVYNVNYALEGSYVAADGRDGDLKAIFRPATLAGLDTISTTVNGETVLVAEEEEEDVCLGGVDNFKFYIMKASESSYVIRPISAPNYYLYNLNGKLGFTNQVEKALVVTLGEGDATANEDVEVATVKVVSGEGNVTITGAAGKKVVISNILGQVVANTVVSSDNATIAAPQGIVVVAVEGEEAVKAIVK